MAQHYFVAQREAKKCEIIFVSTRPGPCRERLALTLYRKTVIHGRQQYSNDNFKEIVMALGHLNVKLQSESAASKVVKHMHGACTIPITRNRLSAVSIQKPKTVDINLIH